MEQLWNSAANVWSRTEMSVVQANIIIIIIFFKKDILAYLL